MITHKATHEQFLFHTRIPEVTKAQHLLFHEMVLFHIVIEGFSDFEAIECTLESTVEFHEYDSASFVLDSYEKFPHDSDLLVTAVLVIRWVVYSL